MVVVHVFVVVHNCSLVVGVNTAVVESAAAAYAAAAVDVDAVTVQAYT